MNLLKLKNKKNNKENWKIKLKKLSIVLIALIVNCLAFLNASYAANINSADLHSLGYCGNLLKYKGVIVKVAYDFEPKVDKAMEEKRRKQTEEMLKREKNPNRPLFSAETTRKIMGAANSNEIEA